MELDSGSGTSVISEDYYNQYFKNCRLNECKIRLCLYNGHKISPLGSFVADVKYLGIRKSLTIIVIKNGGPPLLGRDFMSEFKLSFNIDNKCIQTESQANLKVNCLLKKYSELFNDELGLFNKFKIQLRLKEGSSPKFFKPRSVPFALKAKVEAEIDRLVDLGILVPVEYSEYATPIVPVLRDNGKVKIAGDFSITLNKDLKIEKYPLPRIEEVFAKLGGGVKYTKCDLSNAYNQFVLSDSDGSQELTTINTSKGLFKYTRLVYGLANGPAIFQRAMETLLVGIKGVSCWYDDICITGPNDEVHLNRLEEVLRRLKEAGLRLQKEKCSFFNDSVTYLGYTIDKNGLRTSPVKIKAILDAPCPTNVTELKRFLGVVNYYRGFIPSASSIMSPLHNLLCKDTNWDWGSKEQVAFEAIKKELASDRVLCHYDPEAKLVLTVDAGPEGLGAILSQRCVGDNVERPLAFASRSLTDSERNYSQVQKEATAIMFGVEHFHQFVYGQSEPFILRTDHRPLLSIFGKRKGVSITAALRLQRYALKLSAYNYVIEYISSKKNIVADYFSRAPLKNIGNDPLDNENYSYLNFLDSNILPITFKEIKQITSTDSILQTVIRYMNHGWPRKITCPSISPYFHCKLDLQVENGCLFRGHRIVIPVIFRNQLLKELHSGHFGINKTKSIARARMWWPNIDKDIVEYIGSCAACSSVRAAPPRALPAPWPQSNQPWQRVHIDYLELGNIIYLIVIDSYSKWLECIHMNSGTSTTCLIAKLKELFCIFGIPQTIVSDNDTKINSLEFRNFCNYNGIRYVNSPIYHPASNGQAENSVKTCKKMLKCILNENDVSVKVINNKLLGFLFSYRNTVHTVTGKTPAFLMLGRELRSKLDLIMPTRNSDNLKATDNVIQDRMFEVGENVWVKWFILRKHVWVLGKIIKVIGNRLYEIYVGDYDTNCIRHINQINRYYGRPLEIRREEDNVVNASEQDSNIVASEAPPEIPDHDVVTAAAAAGDDVGATWRNRLRPRNNHVNYKL